MGWLLQVVEQEPLARHETERKLNIILPHPSPTILSILDPLTSPICRNSDSNIPQLVKSVQAKFGLLASLDRILVQGDASRGGERRAFGNPDLKYHQCRYQ